MVNSKLDLINKITNMSDAEFETLQKLLNGETPRIPVPGADNATPASSPNIKNSIYAAATECMISHGFAANLKGYNYVRTALTIMVTEPEAFNDQITLLYLEVGKRHNTTQSRTERAIRHSVTRAYEQHPELFGEEFPSHMKAPTNSEFLYAMADMLKSKYLPTQE